MIGLAFLFLPFNTPQVEDWEPLPWECRHTAACIWMATTRDCEQFIYDPVGGRVIHYGIRWYNCNPREPYLIEDTYSLTAQKVEESAPQECWP